MQFNDVQVGQKFVYNNIEYTKTEPQKVSCCKTLNAVKNDNNEKFMFRPKQEVTIVTEGT